MAMLLHVRAITGRGAVEVDVADEAAFDQRIQAVIDRRHGDLRHALLGAEEDFLDRRVVALVEENVEDMLALRREAEAAGRKPLIEAAIGFDMCR